MAAKRLARSSRRKPGQKSRPQGAARRATSSARSGRSGRAGAPSKRARRTVTAPSGGRRAGSNGSRGARRTAGSITPRTPAQAAPSLRFQHMDYTTHALDEVRQFYTELLGFSDFRHDERFQYLTVSTGPSSSLGFMPPLPGPPELWRPPREPAIYLRVADVDRLHRALSARGIAFEQAPTDTPEGDRVARLRDPEGRMVCLATASGRTTKRGVET
jgi:predicted enzyme related to lactoylglutathione lyase